MTKKKAPRSGSRRGVELQRNEGVSFFVSRLDCQHRIGRFCHAQPGFPHERGPGRAGRTERAGHAARAERLGLVNRVVPDAELASAAQAPAQQIADGPADAIRMMKQNLNEVASLDYFGAIDREAERIVQLSASENHKEAVRAFVEKRKPVFNRT